MRLFAVILLSFILPWTLGIILYVKDKRMVVTIVPLACMLGYVLNTVGIDYGFFYPLPMDGIKPHTVAIFPNTGLLPIESCLFIYAVRHTKLKLVLLDIGISAISGLIDVIFIAVRFLAYNKGWNIPWTMLIYLISFYVIYLYYLWLKKLSILPNPPKSD